MSAGMAGVIAAHSGYTLKMPHDYKAPFILACNGCGDERPIINEVGNVRTPPQRHNMHVAEELAKAGYGNVRAEVERARTDNEHIKPGAGAYSSGFHYALDAVAGAPDPLAVALADPEGHALVKAIHDRKAGA